MMDYAIAIAAIVLLALLAAWVFTFAGIPFWVGLIVFFACGAIGFASTAFWK
jgi:hypothetical protein